MTIAELIITTARERGLRHFFGLPGGGVPLDLMEEGRKHGVDFVSMAHESSAAITAAYYGAVKKTAGLVMSVKGIGAGNLVGGVTNVYFERLPLIALCEFPPASLLPYELIQQCDQPKLFEAVSKYQTVLEPEKASAMVGEAFFRAAEGRPGPAVLHFPSDLGGAQAPAAPSTSRSGESVIPSEADFIKVQEFIGECQRPVILAGADVIRAGACDELAKFAEGIGAAVLVTVEARGVFPETDPRWAGVYMGFFNPNVVETKVFDRADAVFLIGVDAMMSHGPWKLKLPVCELSARAEYGSPCPSPKVRLNGELKSILARLSVASKAGFSGADVQSCRNEILPYFRRPARARFAVQDIVEVMQELFPAGGTLFTETGAFICTLEHFWKVDQPGTYYGTSGGRTMGLMVPAILGARLADPERPMMGLGADGSLLMRLGELEVFARMGVAVPLVIINDHALGTMKSRQQSRGLPDYGLDLHATDLAAVARACGLKGATVDTPEALRRELREALRAKMTTIIDARIDPDIYHASFGPTIGDMRRVPWTDEDRVEK